MCGLRSCANCCYRHSIDDGSNSYYIDAYPYGLNYAKEPRILMFDITSSCTASISPHIFAGNGWASMVFGGWQISGIWNIHSGFSWTPVYSNTGCSVVYANSGYCTALGGRIVEFQARFSF